VQDAICCFCAFSHSPDRYQALALRKGIFDEVMRHFAQENVSLRFCRAAGGDGGTAMFQRLAIPV